MIATRSMDDVRRQWLRRSTTLASFAVCAAFVVVYAALGAYLSAIATAVTALVMLVAYVSARIGKHQKTAQIAASVASLGAVFAIARGLGGVDSPAMGWLYLPPILAYLRLGKTAGAITLSGAIACAFAVALLPGEQIVSDETLHVIHLINRPAVVLMGFVVVLLFERARKNTDELFAAANEALERARDAAETANRMKSEFVASVSHEVRTPLHAMLGMTDVLLTTPLDDKQRELAGNARNAGASLAVLVDDLLDASRLDAGRLVLHPAPADVGEVVRGVAGMYAGAAAEKRVGFDVVLQPGVPKLVLDAARVRQIVTNLVDNAMKFTDSGAVALRLTWERTSETRVRLRVVVEDSGIGIAADQRDAIFERFRQVDNSTTRRHGGAGLGLAIAKDLVGMMGGTIEVTSSPGAGSTFVVVLEAAVAAELDAVDLTGARVLLAEDNLLNQRLAVHLLERLGCRVDVAQDGAEAVRLVDERRYDVVIMDCHMPKMDGYLAAAAIRAKLGRELPIIALTASGSADDMARAREAGMNGFLTKPIDADGMRASIAGVLNGSRSSATV